MHARARVVVALKRKNNMKSLCLVALVALHLALFFFDRAGAQSIAAGYGHACAILQGGVLKCWGKNDYGQLGLGDTDNRGDAAGEMGSSLPAVTLGTGRTAKRVFASGYHTCAILDDDKVKCWGRNSAGQVGIGSVSFTYNRGDGANEMGDDLPYVNLGTSSTVKTMSLGLLHACALMESGDVKCWGENNYAQLGIDSTVDKNAPAAVLMGTTTATAIACGMYHTCAIIASGDVKCWGRKNNGQLGADYGATVLRGDALGETASASTLKTWAPGAPRRASPPGVITRARFWTTTPSSAGVKTNTVSSDKETRKTSAARQPRKICQT